MVAVKKKFPLQADGTLDIQGWLSYIKIASHLSETDLIEKAIHLTEENSKGLTTFYGQPCLEQGLEMAEIIIDLKLDQEAVAAAILTTTLQNTTLSIDSIKEKLNENIAKLLTAVKQMEILNNLLPSIHKKRNELQIDRLRKTYLAMISDIRVVLLKLALQLCIMRNIKNISPIERARIGQETLDIYTPLANRLGIGQIKWELEDLAFHYTDSQKYKMIAKFLAERRVDREHRIHEVIKRLKDTLKIHHIKAHITGRAKHIYSIYLKMQKKHLDFKNIYDASAVRVLVPTIEDCYNVLSIIHGLWEHIPQEFDDYIANPKPNGYSSIHTAVIDQDNKNLEIQIRTFEMHQKAEHGLAAHWLYKESKTQTSGYEAKITFLRQLFSWHKQLAKKEGVQEKAFDAIFEDRIYVFTPDNDIVDLPKGATPLDFAYHIHSAIGHRCRGAKINGHIVPLTYVLQTSDRVEIITTPNGTPSRDWLNKELGYLKTARARAKVSQWFKQLEVTQYIETAKHTLEREFARHNLPHVDLQKIAMRLNFKNAESLLSALGHGSIRPAQIVQAAVLDENENKKISSGIEKNITTALPKRESAGAFQIAGIGDLLTRIAKCCKPIPGDAIKGYITQGRGVTIHRMDCINLKAAPTHHEDRIIAVNWDNKTLGDFYVDLQIRAQGREELLREITVVLANAKINLVQMNSTISQKNNLLLIKLTVQINNHSQLQKLLQLLNQLPNVSDVKRITEQ